MFWQFVGSREWLIWSWPGAALLLGIICFQVQLDVMVNTWLGSFFDIVQNALEQPGNVGAGDLYVALWPLARIIVVKCVVSVFRRFFTHHWLFRWRQALIDDYTRNWCQIRHIEGASQRVQQDTREFTKIMDHIGVDFIHSFLNLVAFLPILTELSEKVDTFPLVGEMDNGLTYLAILWAIFGTVLIPLVGIKLPGLEVAKQKVEAAYRKELVYGEDNPERAGRQVCNSLFDDTRKVHFSIFFNYLYFDAVKWSYLHFGGFIPKLALVPTIVTAGFTYGEMHKITHIFGKIEESFQFVVHNWSTMVDLVAVQKRLHALEGDIHDDIDCNTDLELQESSSSNEGVEKYPAACTHGTTPNYPSAQEASCGALNNSVTALE